MRKGVAVQNSERALLPLSSEPAGLLWILASRPTASIQDLVVGKVVVYNWAFRPADEASSKAGRRPLSAPGPIVDPTVKDTSTLKEGSAVTEQSQPEWRTMGDDEDTGIWAIGLLLFAAIVMIMAGAFQVFTGLVAIFNDQFLIPARNYLFQFDRTSWGWTHLILGVLVTVAGAGLLAGRTWARAFAIVLAVCSALVMFAFLPQYPLWAMVIIALDITVIWAIVSLREA